MISGFLLAYIFLKKGQNSLIAYLVAIIQRILRIWPAFFFTITFFAFIFIHIGSGPLWGLLDIYITRCEHTWKSLLFDGNLFDDGYHMCMGWSWYLQVDIQIFLVCILLLYIYKKNRLLFYFLIASMIVGSSLFLFIISMNE